MTSIPRLGASRIERLRSMAVGAAALLVLGLTVLPGRPALAYPAPTVEVEGHGWGHGRGMGQYGALGYAVDERWDYGSILGHFYGGTSPAAMGDGIIAVRLTRFENVDLVVAQERGHMQTPSAPGQHSGLLVHRIGPNVFQVFSGSGCGGPWALVNGSAIGPVVIEPTNHTGEREEMLQVCEPTGTTRWLRGSLRSFEEDAIQRTVNELPLEAYLRGVVPAESPSSWGGLGGGMGMHALRAQAVAARSYAMSQVQAFGRTCDSTACQVYLGRAEQGSGGFRDVEQPSTDAAVAETAGQVRFRNGAPARAEYSSSTGGWTAGGVFPAVPDDGDDVSLNPNHEWRVSVPVPAVDAAWPEIGHLIGLEVLERNGLGDLGGRVTRMRLVGTAGSVVVTGNDVRSRLGLRSDWFQVFAPDGYLMVASDGGVFSFGNAGFFGSTGGLRLNRPIVGIETTPSGRGYWMVASDGGIFAFGDAGFAGSTGGMRLNQPIVSMAAAPGGRGSGGESGGVPPTDGYWMAASDGGIFAFGDAGFEGSTGAIKLNKPIVGMAATPTGKGYWLVASDGGIFAFGDAAFEGSTGAVKLNKPIVGMAATPTGKGYWLVASDGGIFAFGDAAFHGSTGAVKLNQPIVGMAGTSTGAGYWLVASDGGVFSFGDAGFFGSTGGIRLNKPIVGIAR